MSEDEKPQESKPAEDADAEEAARLKAEAVAKAKAAARAKKEAEEAAKPPWERDPKAPEWLEATDDSLAQVLLETHGEAIRSARTFAGDIVFIVEPAGLEAVCADLKGRGYHLMVDICGAHYPDREEAPFEVIYNVFSLQENRRVRIQVEVPDGFEVPSMTSVWKGANWPEREVYDMFGIRFEGHPDMTRILMWEGFEGHPLRKDFPVEGVETGAAAYPEQYGETAGPVAGTGTGWKPPAPPVEEDSGGDGAEG